MKEKMSTQTSQSRSQHQLLATLPSIAALTM